MLPRIHRLIAAAAITALCVPGAFGQTTTPTQPTDPVLKGPDTANRGTARSAAQSGFGADSIERKKAAKGRPTPPLSLPEFLKSLDALRAAPDADHLTPDQDARIKSIASEFQSASKSYMDKNKAEIDTLRSQLSPSDLNALDQQLARGGDVRLSKRGFGSKKQALKQQAPNSAAPADAAQSAQTRARLVEIYAGRPKPADAEAKILGVLTPDQLTLVQADLTKRETQATDHKRRAHARAKPAQANP